MFIKAELYRIIFVEDINSYEANSIPVDTVFFINIIIMTAT